MGNSLLSDLISRLVKSGLINALPPGGLDRSWGEVAPIGDAGAAATSAAWMQDVNGHIPCLSTSSFRLLHGLAGLVCIQCTEPQ